MALAAARDVEERVTRSAAPSRARAALRASGRAASESIDLGRLAGIEVRVPVSRGIRDEDVDARLSALLRARAPVTALPDGAPLALGDEVLLDAIGYAGGTPLTAQVDAWMSLRPNPSLPGLFEQIAEGRLGEHRVIRIVLPDDYPQPERRSQAAAFVVKTKEAKRPTLPSLDDEQALSVLGRGATVTEVRARIYDELLEERALALVEEAKRRFLDEAQRRLPVAVDEGDVDALLHDEWRAQEGDALARQGATPEEQAAARDAFLHHAERRQEARRALFAERLLASAARAIEDERPHADDVVRLVVQAAAQASLPLSELHTRLIGDGAALARMADKLREGQAFAWLLSRADVRFG